MSFLSMDPPLLCLSWSKNWIVWHASMDSHFVPSFLSVQLISIFYWPVQMSPQSHNAN